MKQLKIWAERGSERWAGLQERERRFIVIGGVTLAVILIYFLVIAPWMAATSKLQRDLPRLRAEMASMRSYAEAARKLTSAPTPVAETSNVVGDLRATLTQSRIAAEPPDIKTDGQGRLHLTLVGADVDAFLGWLDQAQRRHRLRVTSAKLQKNAVPGTARVEMVLELPSKT